MTNGIDVIRKCTHLGDLAPDHSLVDVGGYLTLSLESRDDAGAYEINRLSRIRTEWAAQ